MEAIELFSRVKDRDPDISLATVYRTLSVLKEMGLVEQHLLGEDHGHFETAGESLKDLRVAEITKLDLTIEGGKINAFRARINVSFKYQK